MLISASLREKKRVFCFYYKYLKQWANQPDTPEGTSQIMIATQKTVSSDSTIPTPEPSAQVNSTKETIKTVGNVINTTTISTAISERICGNPNCQTREPSAWRRDLAGTGWLCNACGLFIRARGFHRPKDVCLASAAKLQAMYSNSQSIKLQKSAKQRRSPNNSDAPNSDYGAQPSTTTQTTELSLADDDVVMSEVSTPEPMNDASNIKNEKRSWEKKMYLNCGLYSVDLKYKDIPKKSNKGKQKERPTEILPLPIQYGTFLMTEERNFRLPWDVMTSHKQGMLKRRPASYKKIHCNIFIERRRKHEKPVVCQCILPSDGSSGCTEECYNRVMFYECSPKDCPCKDKCSNQRFQKKERVKELEVIETPNKGFGLRTKVPIRKGQLIIEYRGEVISHETAMQRMETIYKNRRHSYFLDYEKGEVLDGGSRGTEARFINHSCAPNCHIEKWRAPQGELFVGVFASRNIAARTELTYDYNFSKFGGAEEQLCYCGTPTCRGLMGSKRGQKESIKPLKKKVKGSHAVTAYTLSPKEQLTETSAQEESIAGLLSDGSLSSVDSSLAATPTGSSPSTSSSTASNPLLLAVDMLEVDMLDDLMEL
ncbi:histone-lysine N-methyltransferase ASH1L-like [Rhizophagus clarus]|uniref:Histone-lysine N-methyltransferase ASH1L-like n=1 Tax=Rhizophagus clarus TaxID=94130 RepID=A0A8H3LAD0_9GLOM|nr:histone-lysine N-methyltransferase ASH1L-like [Rhizophagus clarus]